jgi:hypothetical protein
MTTHGYNAHSPACQLPGYAGPFDTQSVRPLTPSDDSKDIPRVSDPTAVMGIVEASSAGRPWFLFTTFAFLVSRWYGACVVSRADIWYNSQSATSSEELCIDYTLMRYLTYQGRRSTRSPGYRSLGT